MEYGLGVAVEILECKAGETVLILIVVEYGLGGVAIRLESPVKG